MEKSKNTQHRRRGFTLIEFLFVALCLSLFMIALFQVTIGSMRAFNKGLIQTEMKHQLRSAVDRISVDLRQAVPGGTESFIIPPRDHSEVNTTYQELDFNRFRFAGSEDTVPEVSRVQYQFNDTGSFTMGGVTYHMASLIRTETFEDSTTSTIRVADNIVLKEDDDDISFFMWQILFRYNGTTPFQNNLNVMEINLKMARPDFRHGTPEELEFTTDVALRGDSPTQSTYAVDRVYRFGVPSSLIEP